MATYTRNLTLPADFHFRATVFSHGWCVLPPFSTTTEPVTLRCVLRTPAGPAVPVTLAEADGGVRCTITTPARLTPKDIGRLTSTAESILNTSLDLTSFARAVHADAHTRWMADGGRGRHLRSETFFEDVVKMILTTNCSWSLTEAMTTRLVEVLGDGSEGQPRAFPQADRIAASSESMLRADIRLGYRAPFVHAFAVRVAAGYPIEEFRTSRAPSAELYKELRSIKGVGDYAASNLLKLLGRFDRLGLDSWCRMKFAELHHGGTPAPDEDIERFYARFGEWKGLVMWLDVTKDWYFDKFPA